MKTYPETRTYRWECLGALPQRITSGVAKITWHKTSTQALRSAVGAKPHATWKLVLERLEQIQEETNTTHLTAYEFKALLVACAKEVGWTARVPTRKGFSVHVEGEPDKRCCIKCKEVKDKTDFIAVASDAKKLAYGWEHDGEPTPRRKKYTHISCSACRAKTTRKPKAKKNRAPRPELTAMRKAMYLARNRSTKYLKDDPDQIGDGTLFHQKRLRYLQQVREKLNAKLALDPNCELPARWVDFLEPSQRREMQELFHEHIMRSWNGRGSDPKWY